MEVDDLNFLPLKIDLRQPPLIDDFRSGYFPEAILTINGDSWEVSHKIICVLV